MACHFGRFYTRPSELDIYLEVVRGRDIPWTDYNVGLAVLSLSLVLANWTGVYPIAAVPDLGWAVFVPVAFAVSALVHKYYNVQLGSEEVPPDVDADAVIDNRSRPRRRRPQEG